MKTMIGLSFAIVSLSVAAFSTSGCVSPSPNSNGPFTLSLVDSGSGAGAITTVGASTALNCQTGAFQNCSATYSLGEQITLKAAASANSIFMGWSGGCTGTSPTCVVTMSQAETVTAQFNILQDVFQIAIAGSGAGAVTSAPAGLSCGNFAQVSPTQCSETVNQGSMVTLTETAQPNSQFAGWSGGGCTGTQSTCVVDVSQAETVTATFNAIQDAVQVMIAGTGAGTVTSTPSGINCGAGYASAPTTCSEDIGQGSSITLTAAAQPNSQFAGWSGGGCSGTQSTCVVDVTQAQSVTAIFNVILDTFKITTVGSGAGTVTSAPAGLDCGYGYSGAPTACTENVAQGGSVILTAAPQSHSQFMGWSGAGCTGTAPCTVDVSQAQTVTATFNIILDSFTVMIAGSGTGTVTSTPAGILCGFNNTGNPTVCTENLSQGSIVNLTAAAQPNSQFIGWTGGGCSGTGQCSVDITAAVTVTAAFSIIQDSVQVAIAGAGGGTVVSTPSGINCGANYAGAPTACAVNTNQGGMITLTETPQANSKFAGWSGGGCSGTQNTCVVDVTQAQSIVATYNFILLTAPLVSSINLGATSSGQIQALGINYYIAAFGVFPARGGGSANTSGQPFLGQIMPFAATFAPSGWLLCDGSLLPINQNTALFSLIGTIYGGNGTTNFALPDLRGRVPMGTGGTVATPPPPPGVSDVPLVSSIAQGSTAQGQIDVVGLDYYIATQGVFPAQGGGTVSTSGAYVGQLMSFAPGFAPPGFALCDGTLLPINQNTALFSLIGTIYGGNGTSTFALPDLRARVALGTGALTNPVAPPVSSTFVPLVSSITAGANVQGQVGVQGMGYYISVQGVFPSQGGSSTSSAYLAQIALFAGNFTPPGWQPCNGALLPINQNTALFSLIGTIYGGNGTTTFALPDLRARVPMGVGTN